MESTIETSIGTLSIRACTRDYFNITSPKDPQVLATIERDNDAWRMVGSHIFIDGKKEFATPEEVEEIFALGTRWADAHPEAFELAGIHEFEQIVKGTVDDTLESVVYELETAQEDLHSVLEEPEFVRQAPAALRHQIKDGVRMLRKIRSQVKVTMNAISKQAPLA
jgi:hypothetical protein